jgi:hypothetical protein
MSIQLFVPFTEKEQAKSFGALWNPDMKTWYLPDNKYDQIPAVEKWIPGIDRFDLILSPVLMVAHAHRKCWKCNHINTVIALGSSPYYVRDEDWQEFSFSLFQNVTDMSDFLGDFLKNQYPLFKPGFSKTTRSTYWVNHCEKCKQIQGDFHLFDEPGVAFFPTTSEEASRLTINQYRFIFSPLLNADFSIGDHHDLIREYARW